MPFIILFSLCVGCGAAVPFATSHHWQTQRKMQAAKHWEILAKDIAGQVKKCVSKREDLKGIPVYVTPGEETPFGTIFHELLISELVHRGLAVSQRAREAMKMEYNAQILEHSDRYFQKFPMKFTALGTGVIVARNYENIDAWMDRNRTLDLVGMSAATGFLADVVMSHYGGEPSHNEVIITTSLNFNNALLLHQSDIYYINDPDADHYITEEEAGRNGRTFNVVN